MKSKYKDWDKGITSRYKIGKPYKYEVEYDDNGDPLSESEFCHEAFMNVGIWNQYWADVVVTAENNKQFIYVDNWDKDARDARELKNKTCMEFNIVAQKQAEMISLNISYGPNVEIVPASPKIPSQVTETKTGLLHQIAYESESDIVYGDTYQDLLDCGYGAILLDTDLSCDGTLQEDLYIRKPNSLFDCFWDPNAKKFNKQDGKCAGFKVTMTKDEYKKSFPGIDLPEEGISLGSASGYSSVDTVTVLKYYKRQYRKTKVFMLEDGAQLTESEYEELEKQYKINVKKQMALYEKMIDHVTKNTNVSADKLPPFKPLLRKPPKIKSTETSYRTYVCGYVLTQDRVLRKKVLATDELPVYFIRGAGATINGRWTPLPYALNAHAPQRMCNFAVSEIVDELNNRQRSKVIGSTTNFAAHVKYWSHADRYDFLPYTPDMIGGTKPEYLTPPTFDPNLLQIYQQSREDVEKIMGISQPLSPDASGNARMQNDMSNAPLKGVYELNLNAGIAAVNRGILKLIPSIYGTERTITIRKKTGELDYRTINQNMYELDENNEMRIENDMSLGDFSVKVYGGSSFASQQMMSVNALMNFTKLNVEQVFPYTADIIPGQMPFSWVNQLVIRMRDNVVPPQVVAKEEGKPAPQTPPNPQQQLAEAELKLKQQDLQLKQQELQLKSKEIQIDYELKQEQLKADVGETAAKMVIEAKQTEAKNIESAASVEAAAIKAQSEDRRSLETVMMNMIENQQKNVENAEKSIANMIKGV